MHTNAGVVRTDVKALTLLLPLFPKLPPAAFFGTPGGASTPPDAGVLLGVTDKRPRRGSLMEEPRQVLPALSRSQIQLLLRELVEDKRVHVHGATRAARWHHGPGTPDCNHEAPQVSFVLLTQRAACATSSFCTAASPSQAIATGLHVGCNRATLLGSPGTGTSR